MTSLRRITSALLTFPMLLVGSVTAASATEPVSVRFGGAPDASMLTAKRAHHATFTGTVAADKRSGSTADNPYTKPVEAPGTCTEVVKLTVGYGVFTCTVTWHFTKTTGNICTVDPKVGPVAEADYVSNAGPWTFGNIPLAGWGDAGSGVLHGTFASQLHPGGAVISVTIDASDLCGADTLADDLLGLSVDSASSPSPSSQFSGTADYAY